MGAQVMLANKEPLNIGLFTCSQVRGHTGSKAACGRGLAPGYWRALRRVRRVVRVGVGLPRHDGEVHGVVPDDDAVLELRLWYRNRDDINIIWYMAQDGKLKTSGSI